MTRVAWNAAGERVFEAGVDRGVLYFDDIAGGTPWNGLLNVTEKPSGGTSTPYYFDGVKYLEVSDPDEFMASLEAYTYPDIFAMCEGTVTHSKGGLSFGQQDRLAFHLTYRTRVGNDLQGLDLGYKIHIIYNALAAPTQKGYASVGEQIDPMSFTWEISTTPTDLPGYRPIGHVTIDSRTTDPYLLRYIEDILYGTPTTNPALATPSLLKNLFDTWKTLTVTDNGDGTWTATGPDEVVFMTSSTEFVIDWKSAVMQSADSYTLTTL